MSTWNTSLWGGTLPGGSSGGTGPLLVSDLIYEAFRAARVLGRAGTGYSTDQRNDAFRILNAMLDAWQIERLMVYRIAREIFTLVASQTSYTVGPDGDVDLTYRPVRLAACGVISSDTELPVAVLTQQKYQESPHKSLTGSLPDEVYYDPTPTLGTLYFLPIPTEANQVTLYPWISVQGFETPDEAVVLPPGYRQAIVYNLAVELAAWFPRSDMQPAAYDLARQYKARIKSFNAPRLEMRCDEALVSRSAYDIRSGRYF
jgi:hypothetical protein